jgi:ribosome-associated protein YbcJ (S4-like RNA binding protein)
VEKRKTCKIRAGQKVVVGDIEINVLPAPEAGVEIAG